MRRVRWLRPLFGLKASPTREAEGDYESLINDPDIHVVHNATPNHLHYPVNVAVLNKGKHIVCDKPLAMTAAEFGFFPL